MQHERGRRRAEKDFYTTHHVQQCRSCKPTKPPSIFWLGGFKAKTM
jgi:hypothetical protein